MPSTTVFPFRANIIPSHEGRCMAAYLFWDVARTPLRAMAGDHQFQSVQEAATWLKDAARLHGFQQIHWAAKSLRT